MWKSHSECCRWYPQRWGRVFRARWMSRRYRKRLFDRLSRNRLNCRGDFCSVDWITFYVNIFSRFGCRVCCAKLYLSPSGSLLCLSSRVSSVYMYYGYMFSSTWISENSSGMSSLVLFKQWVLLIISVIILVLILHQGHDQGSNTSSIASGSGMLF